MENKTHTELSAEAELDRANGMSASGGQPGWGEGKTPGGSGLNPEDEEDSARWEGQWAKGG